MGTAPKEYSDRATSSSSRPTRHREVWISNSSSFSIRSLFSSIRVISQSKASRSKKIPLPLLNNNWAWHWEVLIWAGCAKITKDTGTPRIFRPTKPILLQWANCTPKPRAVKGNNTKSQSSNHQAVSLNTKHLSSKKHTLRLLRKRMKRSTHWKRSSPPYTDRRQAARHKHLQPSRKSLIKREGLVLGETRVRSTNQWGTT